MTQIILHWRHVSDLRLEAQHGAWLLSIERAPNWTRAAPAMVYDYAAKATRAAEIHELGTHEDSVNRAREVRGVHQPTQQGVTPMPLTVTLSFDLGDKVRDRFTGFVGHVHAIAKYITGCDRVLVNPRKLDDKGAPVEGTWFDDSQLELLDSQPAPAGKPVGGPAPRAESGLRRA